MQLYGQDKTDSEIKEFVTEYANSVKNQPNDRFNVIMSLVPNGKKVLDYGCGWGWGHYSIALKEKGNDVVGLDLSNNEIEICKLVWGKEEECGVRWAVGNITSLPDSNYDCILSNQVIEHVHNPGHYLSQINRVLKNDGQLIISLPNIMNPRNIIRVVTKDISRHLNEESKKILFQYSKAHDHINSWDPFHFVRLLSSVGFKFDKFIPSEGIAMPINMPFIKPNIFTSQKGLRNLSYTMVFKFIKVKDVKINCDE